MRFQSASSMLISRKRNLHLSDASPQVLYMPRKSSAVPTRRGDSPGGESPCWLRHATNSAVKKPSFSAESHKYVIFRTRVHGEQPVFAVVQAGVEHWFFRTPLH